MLDFPSSPSVGQLHPSPAVAGIPVYKWDGQKWKIGSPPSAATPAATLPLMDGIAGPGSAIQWSRGDHRHPTDARYAPVASPTFTGTLNIETLIAAGNITLGGVIETVADNNHIGDTAAADWTVNTIPSDFSLVFYDFGGGNWAGIGADVNGYFTVRTGAAGSNAGASWCATPDNVHFWVNAAWAPSPPNGDNSNKLATTAYVVANQPQGGPYLPLTGGTVNGTIDVGYGHIMPYRNGATGVLYFGNGDRYLYYDGSNYIVGGSIINTAAGRIWGTSDWTNPVTSARVGGHAGDVAILGVAAMTEPYGGAVCTGQSGWGLSMSGTYGHYVRFRYNQFYVGTWYSSGYA